MSMSYMHNASFWITKKSSVHTANHKIILCNNLRLKLEHLKTVPHPNTRLSRESNLDTFSLVEFCSACRIFFFLWSKWNALKQKEEQTKLRMDSYICWRKNFVYRLKSKAGERLNQHSAWCGHWEWPQRQSACSRIQCPWSWLPTHLQLFPGK